MKYLYLLLLLAASVDVSAAETGSNRRYISVTGSAELQAKPDIAIIYLAVESVQKKSVDAKKNVDERVNHFLAGLTKFKIDEENVSASNIATEPHYTDLPNGKEQLDGYTANRRLKVTLNDLKMLNDLLDFALSVQINEISNIELASSKADALKDQVIALAVGNAKAQGQSLANAFDAKLGRIYSINSTSNQHRSRYGGNSDVEHIEVTGSRMSHADTPGKYLQENIVFSASINVVFDLDVE